MRRRQSCHRLLPSCSRIGRANLLAGATMRLQQVTTMPQIPSIFPKLFLIGAVILNAAFAVHVWGVPRL